jgi:folate-dependent phosphoribosylglycinamide formyltransferase PurN
VHAADTQKSLAARVLEVEHRLLPAVVTELARLGMPRKPVRLFAAGAGFSTGDDLEIRFRG